MIALALVTAWAPVPDGLMAPTAAAEPISATLQVTWTRQGVSGTLAPPSKLRVGDRVTIGVTSSGFSDLGCGLGIAHGFDFAWMATGQQPAEVDGIGHCAPWTFILPPATPGPVTISGRVWGTDTDGGEVVAFDLAELPLQLQSGGTHGTFETNYPVASWAVIDLLGTGAPDMNVPVVLPGPPGATRGCTWELRGEFAWLEARPLDAETCPDWEVTLPDPRPAAYIGHLFIRPWETTIRIGGAGNDSATGAGTTGDTQTPIIAFEGTGGDTLLSNLPTGFAPEPTHPRYVLTGSTITIDPTFLNLDVDGECELQYHGPITPDDGIQIRVPFTDGACESRSFVATEPGGYRASATVFIDGEHKAMANFGVDVLDPMPLPQIDVDTAVVGDPFEVTSWMLSGVPSEYAITVTPVGTAAGLAATGAATETCEDGYLDFHDEERLADADCESSAGGTHRVAVRFEDVTGATRTRTRTITVLAFSDIVGHKFALDITWLAVEGITSGCTATTFCADGLVTRGQMATFLSRALHLSATSRDYFTDDESSKHEASINRLRAAGITFGCAATRFCPNGVVTRGQMASFLVRAFDLPATSRDYFTDDEGNSHEANINRLRASGITSGCGAADYCPNRSVTRGQMAAFLHRAMTN